MIKPVSKLSRKHAKIFNVRLTGTSTGLVLAFVKYRIREGRKFYVVTPNPEIVLASTADRKLARIINKADLALPDGIGLAHAAAFLSLPAPSMKIIRMASFFFQGLWVGLMTFFNQKWLLSQLNILPGREVFLALCGLADKNCWKVFLLGGDGGVAEKVAAKLGRKYKKIKFAYAGGPNLNKNAEPDTEVDILIEKSNVEKINKFRPHLLFVALGPTKQEKWTANNLSKLNIGGAMTVGGTFNYIAGVTPLPPKWMEELGLEWIWRLLTQPWRARRILNAALIFPLKVWWFKLRSA